MTDCFWGNFHRLSHVFHILTNDKKLIKKLTRAINKNKKLDDYLEEMFEQFGDKWAFQYDSAEEAGVDRFGLREIK